MKQTAAVFLGEDPVEVGTLAYEARGHRRSVSFAYGDPGAYLTAPTLVRFDDHLNNHGFLHHAYDQWKLAPAFDLNPVPDKARALKTVARNIGMSATEITSFAPAFEHPER